VDAIHDNGDALKPWQYRSWISIRDPDFALWTSKGGSPAGQTELEGGPACEGVSS
jgi:hypothetical protein